MISAESVSPKHPDKLCDQISDAILDACLEQDPNSRVAIETMGGHGIVTITGELTTSAKIDIRQIADSILHGKYGVQINIVMQSPEIANGVDSGGAGDQGIMVGYATNETRELMPLEVIMSRDLNKYLYSIFPTDGKTQVTLSDDKKTIISVVASFQKAKASELLKITRLFVEENYLGYENTQYFCNPAGDWDMGGFEADTGLTGRKIAVDSYGPNIPIGGGAFSGKDSSKVDRSGAYMARHIAVQELKKRNCQNVMVKIAYAIGYEFPLQVTAIIDGSKIIDLSKDYDCRPRSITKFLELDKPIFLETAKYGHFGNGFKWDS